MNNNLKKLSPGHGLALVVAGVVAMIANHWCVSAFSNIVSLLSLLAVLAGVVLYVAAYKAGERD